MRASTFDVHIHLAGVGTGGSGCWAAPAFQERYTFRLMRHLHGISPERPTADADWADLVADWVEGSGLDYGVALGFDGAYDPEGRLDRERTQMLVPPDWVFRSCERHPRLLPGPSLNPLRADALDRLAECVERGAVLIKWLPMAQGIDPLHPATAPFYEGMARAGIPLLIHMGGERTFLTLEPKLNNVRLLRGPLEAGVKVICAHTATRILFSREPDQLPLLRELLEEYPNLWVDNSGMCNPGRYAHLPGLAADSRIWERTVYGSDMPVPSHASYFVRELGVRRALRMDRTIPNPIARDVEIKRALGYPDRTLRQAAGVLGNLDRWIPSLPSSARPAGGGEGGGGAQKR